MSVSKWRQDPITDDNNLLQSGMLSREQLIQLFRLFSIEISKPEVKKRIADAVKDKKEAVAVTTEIQEEILLKMGIDPNFGIACFGKVNAIFENDKELMLQFYQFVAGEESACDEADLGPDKFAKKNQQLQKLQEQQLLMLRQMRQYSVEEQRSILQQLQEQMRQQQFDCNSSIMSAERMQELVAKD